MSKFAIWGKSDKIVLMIYGQALVNEARKSLTEALEGVGLVIPEDLSVTQLREVVRLATISLQDGQLDEKIRELIQESMNSWSDYNNGVEKITGRSRELT